MLFWIWAASFLVFSAIGSFRLRAAPPERYAGFIVACAFGWALLPAITRDCGKI